MEAKARKVRSSLDTGPSIGLGMVQRSTRQEIQQGKKVMQKRERPWRGYCLFVDLFFCFLLMFPASLVMELR